MLPPSPPAFFGYVKVELLARYPHRWGWRVFKDEGDYVVLSSEPLFPTAEAAWRDGRQVLVMLEQGETVKGLRAMMQIT